MQICSRNGPHVGRVAYPSPRLEALAHMSTTSMAHSWVLAAAASYLTAVKLLVTSTDPKNCLLVSPGLCRALRQPGDGGRSVRAPRGATLLTERFQMRVTGSSFQGAVELRERESARAGWPGVGAAVYFGASSGHAQDAACAGNVECAAYNDLRSSSGLCFEQDLKSWWDTSCPVKVGRFLVAVQQQRNATG